MNMFFLVVCCMIDLLITSSQCSKIYELRKRFLSSQPDMKKYCSKIGSCEPGTHVACTYFFQQDSMGAKCNNAKPIKLTRSMQTRILSSVNGIRKRLAEGLETGNEQILPRAYGMVEIQWDQELAQFAQLWANQCEEGYDKCRSTEKFPNVAQTDYSFIKRLRGGHDSWENSLTVNKLEKIIETSIDYWRRGKTSVTRQMILSSGYFLEYLQMIHGQNTHLGCGMAAYIRQSPNNKTQNSSHLIIRLTCNWSHQLKPNSLVYDVDPPQGQGGGRSTNCGCYPGQTEGDGCMCKALFQVQTSNIARANIECDEVLPNIVVLPIFAFEDGHDIPLSKLTNLTAEYINQYKGDTGIYDGGAVAQDKPLVQSLRVSPSPTRKMSESVQNQEHKGPNLNNLKLTDMSPLKELVEKYLASVRHVHSPVPGASVAIRRSAAKTPNFVPFKVNHPVNYDYRGYLDDSVKRTRRVSFDLKNSNYHQTPDIRNIKAKDLNQLLIALLENLVYHGNINHLIAKIHNAEVNEESDYKNVIPPKPVKQNNLIDNLEHYEDEARNDDQIYSNSDYRSFIAGESREPVWPSIRRQNPLTHSTYDNNYDYYADDSDYSYEKIIRNIERDILQANLDNKGVNFIRTDDIPTIDD